MAPYLRVDKMSIQSRSHIFLREAMRCCSSLQLAYKSCISALDACLSQFFFHDFVSGSLADFVDDKMPGPPRIGH